MWFRVSPSQKETASGSRYVDPRCNAGYCPLSRRLSSRGLITYVGVSALIVGCTFQSSTRTRGSASRVTLSGRFVRAASELTPARPLDSHDSNFVRQPGVALDHAQLLVALFDKQSLEPGHCDLQFLRAGTPSSEVTEPFCRVPWRELSRAPGYALPTYLCRFRVQFNLAFAHLELFWEVFNLTLGSGTRPPLKEVFLPPIVTRAIALKSFVFFVLPWLARMSVGMLTHCPSTTPGNPGWP